MPPRMTSYYYNDGEISINDCGVTWTIDDIFWFPQMPNIEISSPKFCVADITWRLRAFPCGRNSAGFENTQGWFGIALCACGPHDILDDKAFSIRFRILGRNGEVVNCVPDRRARWYVSYRLLTNKKLKSKRNVIAPDNVLTILCEIQNKELARSETESDNDDNAEEIKEIVYEKVSICTEAVGGTTTEDGDTKGPNTTQNCTKENSDDCSTASTDTEVESDYCSAASTVTETESGEEEHAEANYATTPNVGGHLSALPKGVAKALQDYKQLLLSEMHSNITIEVRNKKFKAHRNILAARTPVFAAMLKHNMREKATGVVTIKDMDPEAFPDFLEYLYTGQVQNLSSSNVLELFTAADKYQVKELREECFVYMKENLSVDNFCGILSVSLRHHEMELTALATHFFIENAVNIVKTSKWQIFMTENLVAANELFIKHLEFNNRNQKQN